MDLDKLKLLEHKIERVLAEHAAVCSQRDQLSRDLAKAEERIEEAMSRLREYEQERAEVRSRVERVLNRLEGGRPHVTGLKYSEEGKKPAGDQRQPVQVEIMGHTYHVVSDDGPDHVRQAADHVASKMAEVAAGGMISSPYTLAVMAALNIASEYQKLVEEFGTLEKAIERLATKLVD